MIVPIRKAETSRLSVPTVVVLFFLKALVSTCKGKRTTTAVARTGFVPLNLVVRAGSGVQSRPTTDAFYKFLGSVNLDFFDYEMWPNNSSFLENLGIVSHQTVWCIFSQPKEEVK